jgi:hypothetical protein
LGLAPIGIGRQGIPVAVAVEINIWIGSGAGGRANHVRVNDCETGNRIAKSVAREIAGAHSQRRHQTRKRNAVALIFLFAIDEEKHLVLANGSANGAAKLVQVEFFRGGGKVALGIEIGIAHKFVERPVNVVGPGFCGDQHGGSGAGTVFGGVSVGKNLEFLNVIDRGENADTPCGQFVIVDAIEQPVCAVGTGATDRQREGTACGHLTARGGGEKAVGVRFRRSAGGERGELNEIATIQGELRHLLRGDDLAER